MKLESLGYTQAPRWQRDDHSTSLTDLVCFLPSRVREINQISVSVMIMASMILKNKIIKVKWLMCHMACRQVLA